MKTCLMCKLPVDDKTWEDFSGMHVKCENESYDCRDHGGEE